MPGNDHIMMERVVISMDGLIPDLLPALNFGYLARYVSVASPAVEAGFAVPISSDIALFGGSSIYGNPGDPMTRDLVCMTDEIENIYGGNFNIPETLQYLDVSSKRQDLSESMTGLDYGTNDGIYVPGSGFYVVGTHWYMQEYIARHRIVVFHVPYTPPPGTGSRAMPVSYGSGADEGDEHGSGIRICSPASDGMISISSDNSDGMSGFVEVFDMTGRIVGTGTLDEILSIDVGTPGVFSVRIVMENGDQVVSKVVVIR